MTKVTINTPGSTRVSINDQSKEVVRTIGIGGGNGGETSNTDIGPPYDKANSANIVASAAFDAANAASGGSIISAYNQANTSTYIANLAFDAANSANSLVATAFNYANGVNSNTFSAIATSIAAYNQANTDWTYAANNVMLVANSAYDKANTANITADFSNTRSLFANNSASAAFDKANAANIVAEAAFGYANGVNTNTFTSIATAISAFDYANGVNSNTFSSRAIAIAAYIQANTDWTYAANDVMRTANSAFGYANGINTNTFTALATSIAAFGYANGVNANTFTAIATGIAAYTKANLAYTFAANNAHLTANSAYAAANTTWTYAANNVQLIANSAYAKANSANIYTDTVNAVAWFANNAAIAAFEKANTGTSGGVAFDTANAAYDKANSANILASDAYARANVANNLPVGNTLSNTYYSTRATRNQLNFVPGTNVTIDVNDDASGNRTNVVISAVTSNPEGDPSFAFNAANSAYDKANSANIIADASFAKANLAYTFAANNAFLVGNSAYAAANTTWTYAANNVQLIANSAYDKANSANIIAVSAFGYANGVNSNTFTALATSIAAFGYANGVNANTFTAIATGIAAFGYANGVNANTFTAIATGIAAFTRANAAYTFAANNAQLTANSAYAAANTTWTYAANVVMSAANAAFAMANAANLMPVGNTMANGYWTIRATRRRINMIPGGDWITINVDDDSTLNTSNITITTNLTGAFTQANLAWDKANLAYTFAANNAFLVGNSAYGAANIAYTFAANNAFLVGNSAYAAANIAYTFAANNAHLTANSAYAKANAANLIAEAAIIHANASYTLANSIYTYAANVVMSAANAAFSQANGANIVPVGNTMSNGYYVVRSSKRQVNFIPGSSWDTINVDTDATLNTSNITITTNLTGAFTQANLAWDKANLAYTFAANNAHLTANSAYAYANGVNTNTFTALATSIAAFGYANGVNANTFSALAIGIAAFAAGNTTWTYAANNVQLIANAAFAMANAANLMPVGNTMANGYYTVRSSKRRINFIPGSNITINVDDDPTLNTANITITSTASGGDPSAAFDRANIANLQPVGNTMANGYYTIRSTKNQINFIPGSSISINVDDDPTLNTVNITIGAIITGGDPIYAFTQANAAQITANAAFDKANAANIIADSAFGYANGVNSNTFIAIATGIAAYTAGNTTWTYAANNVQLIANSAYTKANAANLIAEAAIIHANAAHILANSTYTYAANNVQLIANAAFAMANAANLMPVGNTMANGYYTVRSTLRQINMIPGGDWISINVNPDTTLNTSNIIVTANLTGAFTQANLAWDKANLAYTFAANNAHLTANSAYAYANGINTNTFTALATSIAAFGYANGVNANTFTAIATGIAAYGAANLAYTFAANNAFLVGNSAYAAANTTWTYAANTVMSAANAAFSQANGANIIPIGNTMSNGYYIVRSSKRQVNFIPGSSWDTINVDTDATLNTSNITITTNLTGAFTQANLAWDKANLAYTFAANSAFLVGNSAFAFANSVNANTFSALAIGIAAYAAGNTTWTYAANNVQLIANAAFAMANAANLMPVGNTMANGYWTIRATRRRINMVPGNEWVTINVNDDASLNTANVIVTTNLTGAFTQANLAWDKANLAYTFAANNAHLTANSAYAAANTTWTYAANNVQLIANAAFAMANAANLMPVGNTMANGYWTIRATRRRINMIPGSNITINVDDDPTLNTANITINASVPGGGDPGPAFDRANLANLMPVGNTMSNGYYTIRSTKNQINFIPGSNITINVNDDPTMNTANVTIASTGGGSGLPNTSGVTFEGNLYINGELSAQSKSFLVSHPSKENMMLQYGSLEGPEHGVYVRGKLQKEQIIYLPDYWVELVNADTITVQVTPIGQYNFWPISIVSVANNIVTLNRKATCYYIVHGERKDVKRLVIEFEKDDEND